MNKRFFIAVLAALLCILNHSSAGAQTGDVIELSVPFVVGEHVTAAFNGTVCKIGEVLQIPVSTRWPAYTASAWGENGAVCASAVNAIHLLVSVEKGQGRTLSIIPKDTIAPAAKPGTAVVVSSKAGSDLFGAWAPEVGSEVFVAKNGSEPTRLSKNNLPKKGDTLIIRCKLSEMPYSVDAENRPGGRIITYGANGAKVIGRVLKPVAGTGRFEGTKFQTMGRLRANHPGVIDFSTSKYGTIGGFQIIPWDHALTSKEMQSAWNMTQWMIVAPIDGKSKMGGTTPLFGHALVSGPNSEEKLWDIWADYGRRTILRVRTDGGELHKTESIEGKQDGALRDVTHLRISYPITDEPLKKK